MIQRCVLFKITAIPPTQTDRGWEGQTRSNRWAVTGEGGGVRSVWVFIIICRKWSSHMTTQLNYLLERRKKNTNGD